MKTISCILLVCPLSLMGYVEETQEEQVETNRRIAGSE